MNKMERAAEAWARCVARVDNEFEVEESLAFYAEELADILEGKDAVDWAAYEADQERYLDEERQDEVA